MLATEFNGYEKGERSSPFGLSGLSSSRTGKGPLIYQQLNTLLGSGVFNSDGKLFALSSNSEKIDLAPSRRGDVEVSCRFPSL